MTPLEKYLSEVEERADNATLGPWKYYPAIEYDDWQIHNSEFTFVKQDDSGVSVCKEDGDFIAHARTDIPTLLKLVRKLIEERSCLRSVLSEWNTDKSCYVQWTRANDFNKELMDIIAKGEG